MPRLLMNCDQVFDVLTRGPFPTGADSDEAVEHHLRACHECRQLAEALQPAVELLHEAIPARDAADLPQYQGLLASVERTVATAADVRTTPLAVRRLARTAAPAARGGEFRLADWGQLAAAVVLMASLAVLAYGLVSTTRGGHGQGDLMAGILPPSGPKTVARLDDRGLMTLASLNLPGTCFPRTALVESQLAGHQPAPSAAASKDVLRCCTECHNPANPNRPAIRTVAAMQRSCVACHSL